MSGAALLLGDAPPGTVPAPAPAPAEGPCTRRRDPARQCLRTEALRLRPPRSHPPARRREAAGPRGRGPRPPPAVGGSEGPPGPRAHQRLPPGLTLRRAAAARPACRGDQSTASSNSSPSHAARRRRSSASCRARPRRRPCSRIRAAQTEGRRGPATGRPERAAWGRGSEQRQRLLQRPPRRRRANRTRRAARPKSKVDPHGTSTASAPAGCRRPRLRRPQAAPLSSGHAPERRARRCHAPDLSRGPIARGPTAAPPLLATEADVTSASSRSRSRAWVIVLWGRPWLGPRLGVPSSSRCRTVTAQPRSYIPRPGGRLAGSMRARWGPSPLGGRRVLACTGSEPGSGRSWVPPSEVFLLPASVSCFRLCAAALELLSVSSSGHFRWVFGVPAKQVLGRLFRTHPPCTLPRTARWEDAAWSAAPPGLLTTRCWQLEKARLKTTSPWMGCFCV